MARQAPGRYAIRRTTNKSPGSSNELATTSEQLLTIALGALALIGGGVAAVLLGRGRGATNRA